MIKIIAAVTALFTTGVVTVHAQEITDSTYTITGIVEDSSVKRVSLLYMDFNTRRERIIYAAGDTVRNGKFAILSKAPATCLVKLYANGNYDEGIRFLLKPGGVYTVVIKDSIGNVQVKGGDDRTQPVYLELQKQLNPIEAAINRLYAVDGKEQTAEQKKEAEKHIALLNAESNTLADSFVRRYPDSEISLQLVYQRLSRMGDMVQGDSLFAGLSAAVKNTPAGKQLAAEMQVEKAKLNVPARDFTQNTPEGVAVALSSYKGRYVLVDFWASWCGPCRAENPNVLQAYQLYHTKGLEILAVSLDSKKEAWLKAIKDDHLPWTQVSSLTGWNNEAAKLYQINAIPQNLLINPQGIVIARNLRGEDLQKKLQTIFR